MHTQQAELLEPITAIQHASPAPKEAGAMVMASGMTPPALLEMAIKQGTSVEILSRLMDLAERHEKNEAIKAFNLALAEFKAKAISIVKKHEVNYQNKTGGKTSYKHAELWDVIAAVGPALSECGFSWNWKTHQDGEWIYVKCTLRHSLGYVEETTMGGPPDDSGGKNRIQAIGSTVSYLERYTFKAITGVAEGGEDNDGRGATEGESTAPKSHPHNEHKHAGQSATGVSDPPFDTDAPAQDASLFYDEAQFQANLATWRQTIQSARKTADALITHIEARGGKPLTENQKAALRGTK